jgi:isopentenyl phosphate kinase
VQPSASALCRDGVLEELATAPIAAMLEHGAVPLVYGDVAVDDVRGCTIISTEQVLAHLARALRPQRIILVGEVAGVYSGDPSRDAVVRLIPEISPANYAEVETMLTTSFGVDVTGGMLSKVQTLFAVAREQPEMRVHVITGRRNRLIEQVLVDPALHEGTCMHG